MSEKQETIKWRAVYLDTEQSITPEAILSESEKTVLTQYGRVRKETDYYVYRDTWEEAHAWLIDHSAKQVIVANHNLRMAEISDSKVKGMVKP